MQWDCDGIMLTVLTDMEDRLYFMGFSAVGMF